MLGVGIDGGNGKEWESNAKSIQLIKQRGKVKALDEEIHSKLSKLMPWFVFWFTFKILNIICVGLSLFHF